MDWGIMKPFEKAAWVINALSAVIYLCWLSLAASDVYDRQDGVVLLLPLVPMIFVFVFLHRPKADETASNNNPKED